AVLCVPWLLYALPHASQAHNILFSDPSVTSLSRIKEFVRVTAYSVTGGFSLADEFNPWLALLVAAPVLIGLAGRRLWTAAGDLQESWHPSHPALLDPRASLAPFPAAEQKPSKAPKPATLVCALMVGVTLAFYLI